MPIVCIVGESNSGKTRLLEQLIAELKRRGYRVGAVKHAPHGFEIDHRGKDSWRFAQAGADTVVVSSQERIAVVKKVGEEMSLEQIARQFLSQVDIILAEGYHQTDFPQIAAGRSYDIPALVNGLESRFLGGKSSHPPIGRDGDPPLPT